MSMAVVFAILVILVDNSEHTKTTLGKEDNKNHTKRPEVHNIGNGQRSTAYGRYTMEDPLWGLETLLARSVEVLLYQEPYYLPKR